MNPKRQLRGQVNLGRAIDERGERNESKLQMSHDIGSATAAPLGQNAGGSGGGEEPALPENYVSSLSRSGEAPLDGALVLAGSGGTEITQSVDAPHFTFSSPPAIWQRSGSTINPATSGDRLMVTASSSLGSAQMTALGADNPAVVIDSAYCYAIIARSAANLGLKLDGVSDVKLLDIADVSEAPSGYLRWHSLSDGRPYAVDQHGNRHDLSVQHKQCYGGQQLAGSAAGETWEYAAYPAGATPASVSANAVQQFDFSSGALTEAFGRWTWQASFTESPPSLTQSQIAAGIPFRKFGDGTNREGNCRVVIKARLRVNQVDKFDTVNVALNDSAGSEVANDILPLLTDNVWKELTIAASGTDVSNWSTDLRAGVWAQGKQHTEAGDYPTSIDIESISIEQWVN